MGYKVFGVKVNKETVGDIGYTVNGRRPGLRAVPAGGAEGDATVSAHWPAEVFQTHRCRPPTPRPSSSPSSELVRQGHVRAVARRLEGTPLPSWSACAPPAGGHGEDYYLG